MKKWSIILCSFAVVVLYCLIIKTSNSQVPEVPAAKKVVSGEQAKALVIAYEALKQIPDLATSKKKLENYSVEITQNSNTISIYFIPKYESNKPGFVTVGGESKYGREVKYEIRRKDFKIMKRLFFM